MSDIIDRLKEPEEHYPGNFDTPKRANAMLSCLCQEAAEEIESMRQKLTEWQYVFGHLGTADECGNEWNALISERDALRREVDRLKSEGDKLDAPAVVGNARFGKGVAWRTVIMAAQRRHQETVTPESEAARLEKVAETNLIVSLRDAEIARLNEELAASQAREKQLREDFQTYIDDHEECTDADDWMAMTCSMEAHHVADEAISLPQDTTAIQAYVAKACEVMRERAIAAASAINPIYGSGAAIDAISTVSIVTLDDLK